MRSPMSWSSGMAAARLPGDRGLAIGKGEAVNLGGFK
jgi:hypothetical protein